MPSLSQTIAGLTAARATPFAHPGGSGRLVDLAPPARNPGALRFKGFVPADLPRGAALVVALHGCTQDAAAYDAGTGWSVLAERAGFALLCPEQTRANNPNTCFNWFAPADIARLGGEAESIAAAVQAMVAEHAIDPQRVFVTGLSAGGAMAAAMLAAWPDLFAGGAVIGGLPYACAANVPDALARMRGQGHDDAALALAATRGTRDHARPLPSLSIWHGDADATVHVSNMDRLGRQWRHVHDLADTVPLVTAGANWQRNVWQDADGRAVVEEWRIAGMGHGVPIAPDTGDRLGTAAPFMLDVGVSSTAEIARSWGLHAERAATVDQTPIATDPTPATADIWKGKHQTAPAADAPSGVQQVIENALRAAGLMH